MDDDTYIVKAGEIAAMQGLARTHSLNPQARIVTKSLGDLTGLNALGIHVVEVQPGDETSEYHVHYHEEEAIYVLSGTGTAHVGGTDHAIGPGDFLGYRTCGAAHSITNTGIEVLRCLVIGQRLPHDVADYPRIGKRLFRNVGLPWSLADIDTLVVPAGARKK